MIKRIIDTWKLTATELYVTLLFMLGCGIFGLIIEGVVLTVDAEANSAIIGTLFAIFVGIFANWLFGIFAFGNSFNTVMSLGSTRKEFLIANGVTDYVNVIIETIAIIIFYFVESFLCKVIYADREFDNLVWFLADYRIVLGIIIILPAIKMLGGALILKFKKVAYWIMWALWIVTFLGFNRFADYIAKNPESLIARICSGILEFVTGMSGIAQAVTFLIITCIFIAATVLLVRKEAVTV